MRAPKRETNEQLLRRLLRFNPAGAISHAVILEGILRYATTLSEASEEELDSGLICGASLKCAATHIRDEVRKHLSC